MKSKKPLLALAVSMFILFCLPNLASARTSFQFGIGYGYSNYGWEGRSYRHLDRPWHRSSFGYAPRHHHWRGYRGYPHIGFGINDRYSSVIVETPIIIERPKVITQERIIIKPEYDNENLKLFKNLRTKKSELLRKLELTDKETRKKSIIELVLCKD